MIKRQKKSITFLLSISIIGIMTVCLFLPYGKVRKEEGVADYYLFSRQQLCLESPLIYKDLMDGRTFVFSEIKHNSSSVDAQDFTFGQENFEYDSSFRPSQPDDIIACNDSFAIYKLNESIYRDVFEIYLNSISTDIVGNADEVDNISYRYCSGFYSVHLYSKYRWGNTFERLKNFTAVHEMPQTMDSGKQIIYEHPLLYIPYPIDGSTPYIFSDRIFSTFEFDTRFCEKRNYYAMMYRTPLPLEQMCRVLSYDSNGVLVEVRDEYNAVKYPMYLTKNILPSGRWDKTYKAYIKSPKSLLLKSKFIRKTEPEPVWEEIRTLSSKIDTIPYDYDPMVFINAYDLIVKQKSAEYIQCL